MGVDDDLYEANDIIVIMSLYGYHDNDADEMNSSDTSLSLFIL